MPAARAPGSIFRNWAIDVPVFVWAWAGPERTNTPRKAATMADVFRIRASSLLDDRKFPHLWGDSFGLYTKYIEAGGHIQVVLRPQVPGHVPVVRPVVMERLHH